MIVWNFFLSKYLKYFFFTTASPPPHTPTSYPFQDFLKKIYIIINEKTNCKKFICPLTDGGVKALA